MTRVHIVAACFIGLFLGSCAGASPAPQAASDAQRAGPSPLSARDRPPPGKPQPYVDPQRPKPVPDPPEPLETAAELPPGSALGMPTTMNPAAQAAYWIWESPPGSWHLRTTSGGSPQQYTGRIVGVSGEILGAKPLRADHKDRLRQSRRGLVFDFRSHGEMEGLDFRPSDGGCVRFNLRVAGEPAPKRIFVGAKALEPPRSHFLVCPGG
jgi:hypothetical protein